MWLFERNCPNCKTATHLKQRLIFIKGDYLKCSSCEFILQPGIIWGIITTLLMAPIVYFILYPYCESLFGENIATAILFIVIYLLGRILEPLSALAAHDENSTW